LEECCRVCGKPVYKGLPIRIMRESGEFDYEVRLYCEEHFHIFKFANDLIDRIIEELGRWRKQLNEVGG